MTIRDLIMTLEQYALGQGDNTLLIMSSDGEGNSYSPLAATELMHYVPDSTWSGEGYGIDEDPEEIPEDAVKAVCLWPVN